MPTLQAKDGCRLYYEVHGAGTPVVLIPGLGGDGRFWDGVVRDLQGHFRLIVVDHRGAGRSDRPPGPYKIEQIAADIVEILDAEGCGQVDLVGHSTGGAVVQTIALDAPARAGKLIISGSWCRPDARFRALFGARLALLEHNQPEIYQSLTHVFGHDAVWLAEHEDDLAAAVVSAPISLAPLDVTAARIRMLLAFDRANDISRIDQRCLVVGSEEDILLPLYYSRQIAQAIPHASLMGFGGAHFYPRERPSEFARVVIEFLRK
jgi:aminoacrylate hydrolase